MNTPFNRYVYIAFVLVGLYYAILSKEPMQATIYLGLALVFDPFNTSQKWDDRPLWQRGILVVHLVLTLAMIGWEIFSR